MIPQGVIDFARRHRPISPESLVDQLEKVKSKVLKLRLFGKQEFWFYETFDHFLEHEVELNTLRSWVQALVDKEGLHVSDGMKDWLENTQRVLSDAERLINEMKENRSFVSCPNRIRQYCLGRELLPKILDVKKRLANLEIPVLPLKEFLSDDKLLTTTKPFGKALEEIKLALQDDSVSLVAVWGMAGVGKTILVKEVQKRPTEIHLDRVIMVNVSKRPVLERIQGQIAEFLEFDLKCTGMRKAEGLRLRLKKENRILIILEDVWDKLSLKAIGIPHGEDHKGCKILVTTRCEQVCISMRIQKVIRLDFLSDGEACELLKINAGDLTDRALQNTEVAVRIAKECQGLPTAIVELGGMLRGKNLTFWEITSLTLRSSSFEDSEYFETLTHTKRRIEESYTHLRTKTTKLCFLLCSFFPQDYTIEVEVLTRYAWGLWLFEGIDSIKRARSKVWAAVEYLISSSLLLDNGEATVKMHNLVRRWALGKAIHQFSLKTVPKIGLDKWPTVRDIGERYVGEALQILSLNGAGREISSAFEGGMKSLKVFTLYDGHSSAFALEDLTNLRTLCLVCCRVDSISSLGKLEKLEILSFCGSDISELPDELEGFKNLRLLDLFDCKKLQNIPLKLIRKLSQLEELYFNCQSFEEWWSEEKSKEGRTARPSEQSEASEIISSISLPPNLKTYEITIKEHRSFNDHHSPTSRTLRVTVISHPAVGESARELIRVEDCELQVVFHDDELHYTNQEDNPTLILSNSTWSELIKLPQLTCSWNRLSVHALRYLKVVKIKDCHKLTSVFSSSLAERMVHLEKLEIDGCPALKHITSDTDPLGLLSLTTLKVTNCDLLEYVLRVSSAWFAPLLSVLNISGCPGLKRVIDVVDADIELPQLQRLALKRLESLTTFCSGEFSVGLLSLEKLEVEACPQLMSICEIITRPELKDLRLSSVGNQMCQEIILLQGGYFLSSLEMLMLKEIHDLQVIWKDPSQIVTLQNLSHLEVFKCNKLTNIFSISLARNLPQLRCLGVRECEELKHVVVPDQTSSSMACHKPVYFPYLEEICITKCNKLRSLFPLSASRLPKLKKFEIKDASNLKEIFVYDGEANITRDEKQKEVLLPQLKELFLEKLPELVRFTTVGYYFVFPALVSLIVEDCGSIIIGFNYVHDDSKGSYVRAEIDRFMFPEKGDADSSISMQRIQPQNGRNIRWNRTGN